MPSDSCIGSILITGATSGIGFATLKEFHNRGYFIYFTYFQNVKRALEIEKELPNTKAFQLNLTDNANIRSFFKLFCKLNVHLDALINNAAQTKFVSQDDVKLFDDDEFSYYVQINLVSIYAMIFYFKKLLKDDSIYNKFSFCCCF